MYLIFATLLAVSGCAAAPTSLELNNVPLELVWTQEFPLEELAQQSAAEGECGLALWTRTQPAKRVFFASNTRRFALINFQGEEIALSARHERRDIVRGFSQQQVYAGSDMTIALDLEIETRQDVLASAVIRSGVFTLTQASTGKSLVVPIVGVIGCS